MKGDSIDSSLTIVLSDQPGTVGGAILDGEQKPIPAKVVLVPDRELPPAWVSICGRFAW